jgi:pyruvate kinase
MGGWAPRIRRRAYAASAESLARYIALRREDLRGLQLELIVQGAGVQPLAVMIARGDLAVEIGHRRLVEIQEEILWLCEAAHVPVIWATQVLDAFVKKGRRSRAENTDAAMAERAECVMLNKGPFAADAIAFLDDVLGRMEGHQYKKAARMRALRTW